MDPILALVWQAVPVVPTGPNTLTFAMDLSQLVMLGGLIWGLARMSGSVDRLREVTGELSATNKEIVTTLAATVLDVRELKVRDEERRQRRIDDRRDDA